MTPNPPHVESEPTLRDYLEVLLDRWWVVAATTAAALVAALTFSTLAPPVYRGTATVMVDRAGSSFGLISDITGISQQTFVDTLAEVVRSRAVGERALDRLGVPPDEREEALRRLQAGLRVQRVRNADVIRIQAEGPTPQAAADATNAVAEAFLAWHVEGRRAQAAAGRKFIEDQLAIVGRELRSAEDALAAYKARAGQVALSEQTTLAVTRLADFEAQRRAASAERQAVEASLAQARATLAEQAATVPSSFVLSEDPVAAQLRQQLASAEVELAGLREQFTDRHPQVVAVKAKIEEIKNRMQTLAARRLASQTITLNPIHQDLLGQVIKLQIERQALQAREAALAAVVARYARDARVLPSREVDLARLTREVKVAEQTYLLLSEKLQEARIAEASIVGDLRVVDRAVPPESPVKPRTALNTLLGAVLGVMLGLGAVYTLEAVDTTFKTAEEAGEYLDLPVLATIPIWKEGARSAPAGAVPLAAVEQRRSPFAEAFRHLRTSLLYSSPDRPLRIDQVTSPGPEEGKSTVAANLAVALSQLDRKVWLVECDLRKPHLVLRFQPRTEFGLSELLVDGVSLEQAVHETEVANLWFVPAGRTPPNPAELLGSRKMRAFLSGDLDGAEFVVLDAPPVLPVTDAAVLAPAADGVVLVVDLRRTHRDAARRAKQQLQSVGARLLGVVVNGATPTRRGYYYYYSHYYQAEDQKSDATPLPSPPGESAGEGKLTTSPCVREDRAHTQHPSPPKGGEGEGEGGHP